MGGRAGRLRNAETELLRVSCDTSDGAWHVRLVGEADFSVLDDLTGALGVTAATGARGLDSVALAERAA